MNVTIIPSALGWLKPQIPPYWARAHGAPDPGFAHFVDESGPIEEPPEMRVLTRAERHREVVRAYGRKSGDGNPPPGAERVDAGFWVLPFADPDKLRARQRAVPINSGHSDRDLEDQTLLHWVTPEPEQRVCPVHGATLERQGHLWVCTYRRELRRPASPAFRCRNPRGGIWEADGLGAPYGRECHLRAIRHGHHLQQFRLVGVAISPEGETDAQLPNYSRCECGSPNFVEAPWFDDPCARCGSLVPCEHPLGDAKRLDSRGSTAKPRRGLRCGACALLTVCSLCLNPLHVARGGRLHCSTCEDAFATGGRSGAWRCARCGSRERRMYQDRGELQAGSHWYCGDCQEDSYVTALPARP